MGTRVCVTYMSEEPPLSQQKESLICRDLPCALLIKTQDNSCSLDT